MAVSIVSVLTGFPVRRDVAMTGEITLRGRVLPIGGLKEKLLAALRAGITTVFIPKDNEKDLAEIPDKREEAPSTLIPVAACGRPHRPGAGPQARGDHLGGAGRGAACLIRVVRGRVAASLTPRRPRKDGPPVIRRAAVVARV